MAVDKSDLFESNGSLFIDQVFDNHYFQLIRNYSVFILDNIDLMFKSRTLDMFNLMLYDPERDQITEENYYTPKISYHDDTGKTYSIINNQIIDYSMVKILPMIELLSGCKVRPKGHYLRFHTEETTNWCLPYHTDVTGNDVNVSLNIFNQPENKHWELNVVNYQEQIARYQTELNQGVLYSGKYPHWRDEYPGGKYIQLFLHYVREDNPDKDHLSWTSKHWKSHTEKFYIFNTGKENFMTDRETNEKICKKLIKSKTIKC